jgi:hypothetical protein
MAEPLKNRFGPAVPERIARQIRHVYPHFDTKAFLHAALDGYAGLELMPRVSGLNLPPRGGDYAVRGDGPRYKQ